MSLSACHVVQGHGFVVYIQNHGQKSAATYSLALKLLDRFNNDLFLLFYCMTPLTCLISLKSNIVFEVKKMENLFSVHVTV